MTPGEAPVVAVDVGGTTLKGAVTGVDGEVCLERSRVTPAPGSDVVLDELTDLVRELAAGAQELCGAPAEALGVTVPGVVDPVTGVVGMAVALGWRDLALRGALEDVVPWPVWVGQDVGAAAWAEAQLGSASGVDDFLMVTVGTGIGGATVLDGTVRCGPSGAAGEIGHIVVQPNGPPCACGKRGCVNEIASARAISEGYRAAAHGELVPASEVARRAEAGDQAARRVWRRAVSGLADAVAAAVAVLDVPLVVVGGGAGDPFVAPLQRALAPRLGFRAVPAVKASRFGVRAGVVGAALRARDLSLPPG